MDILSHTLEEIRGFKHKGRNWFEMANLLRDVGQTGAWMTLYPSYPAFLKSAAMESGYALRVIHRMLRVRDFLYRLIEIEGFSLPEGTDLPLAALEILERMYPLDPRKTIQLIGRAVRGEITLRGVQEVYDSVSKEQEKPGKNRLSPRSLRQFEQRAIAATLLNKEIFLGEGEFKTMMHFQGPFALATDLVVIKLPPDECAIGFEFRFVNNAVRYSKDRIALLQKIVFSSEFFRKYWLVFSEGAGSDVGNLLIDDLRRLELFNVEIAIFKDIPDATPREQWFFPESIYQPGISSPPEKNFFPSLKQHSPRWEHLILEHIREHDY